MSYESEIHQAQTDILHCLLFVPHAGFAELQKNTGLASDHFNFHIKKLVDSGYIEKIGDKYCLTVAGKEYANRMDTDQKVMERQPKISVLLIIERAGKDGEYEYLVQQRLKHPFYGFWGLFGGKVGWGESFEETARRELKEESGLDGDFTYKFLHRKRDYKESDKSLLEDKVFAVMFCDNTSGELAADFQGGHSAWLTIEELRSQEKYFTGAPKFLELAHDDMSYFAKDYFYNEDEY